MTHALEQSLPVLIVLHAKLTFRSISLLFFEVHNVNNASERDTNSIEVNSKRNLWLAIIVPDKTKESSLQLGKVKKTFLELNWLQLEARFNLSPVPGCQERQASTRCVLLLMDFLPYRRIAAN